MAALRPLDLCVTERAHAHLEGIYEYISERNPVAARQVMHRIRKATEMLCYFPEAGRSGRSPGTREWVVTGLPYIIVYELSDHPALIVLGVFHGAQDKREM